MNGKKGWKSLAKNSKNNFKLLGIDTNIFIYFLTNNSEFHDQANSLFKFFDLEAQKIITSIITITELLSFPASEAILKTLEQDFNAIPNLQALVVDSNIAIEAANIRRTYHYRLPDSLQLATATISKADVFLTNDLKLKEFKKIRVLTLEDFN